MRLFQVRLRPKVSKDLKKIPQKYRDKILASFVLLVRSPFLGKKLKGRFSNVYSYRVWPYRIIYKIYRNKLLVIIIRIGHRQGVHR